MGNRSVSCNHASGTERHENHGAIGELRDKGAALRTCNAYLAAVKAFTRWAWQHKRMGDDPLRNLTKFNAATDRRRERRALSIEEFERLVVAAETGPAVQELDGSTRAMLYILAAWTGFRRKELASLTLRSFDFDGEPPVVTIDAAHAKGKRTDSIPRHTVVIERLRAWLATRGELAPTEPIFPLRAPGGELRRTSKMMMVDLAAARQLWLQESPNDQIRGERERSDFLRYEGDDGLFADFHANRHTFISNLGRAGVDLVMAQKLARHSDPKLTANVYTHLGISDRSAAIASLPAPPATTAPGPVTEAAALAATGTDNVRAEWEQSGGADEGCPSGKRVKSLAAGWL